MKRLVSIYYHKSKRTPPIHLREAKLVSGMGLTLDYHFGEEIKQLSMSDEETINWIKSFEPRGLCFERFFPNLIVDEMRKLDKDVLLGVGETMLKVTENEKTCFVENCHLFHKGAECKLRDKVVFLSVLRGGVIRSGDTISIKKE